MAKKSKELAQFQEAANHLVAIRILGDYVEALTFLKAVEPEHFVEQWVNKNIIRATTFMKRGIWRYFLLEWQNYLMKKKLE